MVSRLLDRHLESPESAAHLHQGEVVAAPLSIKHPDWEIKAVALAHMAASRTMEWADTVTAMAVTGLSLVRRRPGVNNSLVLISAWRIFSTTAAESARSLTARNCLSLFHLKSPSPRLLHLYPLSADLLAKKEPFPLSLVPRSPPTITNSPYHPHRATGITSRLMEMVRHGILCMLRLSSQSMAIVCASAQELNRRVLMHMGAVQADPASYRRQTLQLQAVSLTRMSLCS